MNQYWFANESPAEQPTITSLGVTGSRYGLSQPQKSFLLQLAFGFVINELHHGDCVGVDQQVNDFFMGLRVGARLYVMTVAHPPLEERWRAHCNSDFVLPCKEYHARDRDIVNASTHVIGCPQRLWPRTGGTWYTIGYARERGRPLAIVLPDKNEMVIERWPELQEMLAKYQEIDQDTKAHST